jgi:AcrR family transcriptional regulator
MATESRGEERIDGRRARHAGRRPELLGRAADHLLAHGLSDVSLRPLAAAMGVSHRAVLHHFGSKEELLVEAVTEVRRREQQRLRTAGEPAGASVGDVLRAVWRRITAPEHLPYARLHFELQAAAGRRPELYGRFLDDLVASWVEVVAARLTGRGLPPDDARAVATFAYATVRGLQLDLLATGDRGRVDAAFAELEAALLTRLERAAGP